jgi:hypothetical protein
VHGAGWRAPGRDGYHRRVALTSQPPFDPRWLDALVVACASRDRRPPALVDLYLERRLEVRVLLERGSLRGEEIHSEGSCVRWRFPSRTLSHAATGVSPAVVARLLARWGPPRTAAPVRAVPPSELDPPRGWREWAGDLVRQLGGSRREVRYLARHAVVVRADGWCAVAAPPLVRVACTGTEDVALLAVWGQPRLADWLRRLAEPAPARRFTPESGSRLPVLFCEGTAGVLLHELLGHLAESDLLAQAASPLARLAGATLTEADLELCDDPTRSDLPGAFSADDEGVPARPIALLSGGRLVGWLCDRAGALRTGGIAGRGRRSGWTTPPIPRMSNLVLAAGKTSRDALENGLGNGLAVTRLASATVDPASGRAVIRVERGWEVRHGRRRRPLAACALTGSVTELLAALDPAIGSDPEPDWRLGWCVKHGAALPTGSEAPSLLIRRVEVL